MSLSIEKNERGTNIMSILKNNIDNFDIYMDYGTFINNNFLYDLYLPIVGNLSIQIYNFLVNEYNSKVNSAIYINTYNKIISKFKISMQELFDALYLLESVALITTYQDNSDLLKPRMVHYINEPLNYFKFIENNNLNLLLKKYISDSEYTSLVYKYNNNTIKSSFINVSKDISYLIDTFEDNNIEFDYINVYSLVSKKINDNFIIDDISKDKLNYYFLKHNFTYEQLANCVFNSMSFLNNNYEVSYSSLVLELSRLESFTRSRDKNTIIKINRKFDFFTLNADNDAFRNIIDDYQNTNSENYLISITKQDLDYEMKKSLNELRNKLFLHDSIINCIIDYSLFHNSGRLVPKYILKIGYSMNNLSIDSLNNAIKYLRSVNANIRPTKALFDNHLDNHINRTTNNDDLNDDIWKGL